MALHIYKCSNLCQKNLLYLLIFNLRHTKGVVNLSTGTICNLSSEFSANTEAERAKIFLLLTYANILYSDATVSNINGKRKAVTI